MSKKTMTALLARVLLSVEFSFLLSWSVFGQAPPGQSQTRPATPRAEAKAASPTTAAPKYDQLVATGYNLLTDGKVQEAYTAALSARRVDSARFEAYALAGLALHAEGFESEANQFVSTALRLAPQSKKPKLNELAKLISDGMTAAKASNAPPELRRKRDALELIMNDVDHATDAGARRSLLIEFLEKSGAFLKNYPDDATIWVLAGAAAAELDSSKLAWEAGRALQRLKAPEGDDPNVRRFMATLERKGWLGDSPPLSRGEEIERRRAAAFSGTWRCLQQRKLDFENRATMRSSNTVYVETSYSSGRFTRAFVSGRFQPFVVDTNDASSLNRDSLGTRKTAHWDGETLVVNVDGDGSSEVDRYQIANGNLTDTSDNQFMPSHGRVTGSNACERVSRQAAVDAINLFKANAKAAMDELFQFVNENSLRVSNLRAEMSHFCALTYTGPDLSLSGTTVDKDEVILAADDYDIQREQSAEAYRVNFAFWFHTRDQASRYVELARKAGQICGDV